MAKVRLAEEATSEKERILMVQTDKERGTLIELHVEEVLLQEGY